MAAPDRPPVRAPSTGRRRATSITIAGSVFTNVTAPAPPAAAAAAIWGRSATAAVSLAQRGRRQADAAATASWVASADWANMPLPSKLGHDRLTSTATTWIGASASSTAASA
jgi:hypothetical protein